MAKRKATRKRKASKGGFASTGGKGFASAGGTGFTGKRPKDKKVMIGKGGFAGGVKGKGAKIGGSPIGF